jgi:O-antigen/teichoic acid export membrane protein
MLALPAFAALALMGEPILAFLFGAEYGGSYLPLIVLALGQLLAALAGPVGLLLAMAGFEKDTARVMGLAAFVNVVLNLALIPRFGPAGAAAASVVTLAVSNIILWRQVHRRLGIESTALGLLSRGWAPGPKPSNGSVKE